MKTYTEEQVARIVELRHVRYALFQDTTRPKNHYKIKVVNSELYILTQNQAYL